MSPTTFGCVIALDLHDSLGHDGDGVGMSLPNSEKRLNEFLQNLKIFFVGFFERNNVLQT
jgi:hypothetical protein